jgi:hypothetical protein
MEEHETAGGIAGAARLRAAQDHAEAVREHLDPGPPFREELEPLHGALETQNEARARRGRLAVREYVARAGLQGFEREREPWGLRSLLSDLAHYAATCGEEPRAVFQDALEAAEDELSEARP